MVNENEKLNLESLNDILMDTENIKRYTNWGLLFYNYNKENLINPYFLNVDLIEELIARSIFSEYRIYLLTKIGKHSILLLIGKTIVRNRSSTIRKKITANINNFLEQEGIEKLDTEIKIYSLQR